MLEFGLGASANLRQLHPFGHHRTVGGSSRRRAGSLRDPERLDGGGLSGRMHIVMDSGEQADVGPGDYVVVEPGHDAWTLGNEACVMLDFAGMEQYARPSREARGEEGASPPRAH